jgi:hypothetical protein
MLSGFDNPIYRVFVGENTDKPGQITALSSFFIPTRCFNFCDES